MKCFNCGAELSDDTKFCSYCGEKMPEQPTKKEEPVEDVIEEENNEYFLDIILGFILEYYYIFLVAIIIFSGIGIYVIDKKSNIYK